MIFLIQDFKGVGAQEIFDNDDKIRLSQIDRQIHAYIHKKGTQVD